MSARRRWKDEEIFAIGSKGTIAEVASIVGLGGKKKAYDLYKAGEFPFPTFEVNGYTWVQMKPVRELLGIEPNGHNPSENSTAGTSPPAEVPPAAETTEEAQPPLGPPRSNVQRPDRSEKEPPSEFKPKPPGQAHRQKVGSVCDA